AILHLQVRLLLCGCFQISTLNVRRKNAGSRSPLSLLMAVRPEGANHQWRKNPLGELLTALLTYVLPSSFLAIPFLRVAQSYWLSDNLWGVIAAEVMFATPFGRSGCENLLPAAHVCLLSSTRSRRRTASGRRRRRASRTCPDRARAAGSARKDQSQQRDRGAR